MASNTGVQELVRLLARKLRRAHVAVPFVVAFPLLSKGYAVALSYLIGRRNVQITPWNSERDALLTRLWAEGYSASAIAEQIMGVDVTRCAVIGRAHRLKLPTRQARAPAKRKPYTRRAGVPKPPPPPPRPQPPPPPNEPKMRRLKLVDLKPTSCRWPIGDGPFLFCGVDAKGETYCPFHQRIARVREKR